MMSVDIVCFCHLRWGFVYQRPQHLLSRFARTHRVFLIEEPVFGAEDNHLVTTIDDATKVHVITPHLIDNSDCKDVLKILLDTALVSMQIEEYILWYYSPMALGWTDHLNPELIVYDCMDELSAFAFAPTQLVQYESRLLQKADLVFTGGQSLFEAKKDLHHNIHPFPSSVDKAHFEKARSITQEPADQAAIPHPRIGYYGVLDERLDLNLLTTIASMRPQWHFVLLGPIVKIDSALLPKRNNIHYLGAKQYNELPQYLAGWDIAMMPFAQNESTRYISPTKTPEYLSGGKPVISTPVKDVVDSYGAHGLVQIAVTPAIFIAAAEAILTKVGYKEWLAKVDDYLSGTSWDNTWQRMETLINKALNNKPKKVKRYV